MAQQIKIKRKVWSREETLLFLACYKERQSEFQNARKKRNAFSNVLESMIFKGFKDTNVTPLALEAKMRSLLSSFKAANDNNGQTGASPCSVPYFEELNEIFGDKPCNKHGHSLSLGTRQAHEIGALNFDINAPIGVSCLPTQCAPLPSASANSSPFYCRNFTTSTNTVAPITNYTTINSPTPSYTNVNSPPVNYASIDSPTPSYTNVNSPPANYANINTPTPSHTNPDSPNNTSSHPFNINIRPPQSFETNIPNNTSNPSSSPCNKRKKTAVEKYCDAKLKIEEEKLRIKAMVANRKLKFYDTCEQFLKERSRKE